MSDADTQIGFEQTGLGALLKGNQLVVPVNQRDYAWEKKEVTTLFQDLERSIAAGESSYFLGTIVTIPRRGALEVVDGQQRLATTAILLSAIRDYIKPVVPLLAESINGEILTRIDREVLERVPSLKLNLDDNDYFRARLTLTTPAPETTKPSHKLIDEAFAQAHLRVASIVSGLDIKDHGPRLNQWVNFLEKKAEVILLKVPNAANAYRIFETLNDRGKRASQSDLVKNHLFAYADSRIAEVQQRWTYMRGTLEGLSDDEDLTITFLRHVITVIWGFVREKDVYVEVQRHTIAEGPVVTFAGQLEDLAGWYVAIQNSESEKWNTYSDSACRALNAINLFDILPMRPLVLAIARRFPERLAADALKLLVSLSVRLMITNGTRTGSTEQGLADAAHKVFAATITSVAALATELKSITPTDAEFAQSFESATVSNHKFARYYLRSLEMAARTEPEPWHIPNDDADQINLEHVLPQRPGANWPQFDSDQAKLYCKRIGNLVLMRKSQNTNIQNLPFAAKQPILAQSPYSLTNQIGTAADWTVVEITKRQRILAGLALTTWPI
jgi:hypothetical protein